MLKKHFMTGLAAMALMTASAVAQTTAPSTNQPATPAPQSSSSSSMSSGPTLTHMTADMMRGSKLKGVNVYGSDNQKIGDIDELLIDHSGKIQAIVVGVGGFLGIGEKRVAIPYESVQWMNEPSRTATTTTTTTTGGVSAPAAPNANQPATTGSTTTSTATADNDGVPDRAVVRMSKADLQNAPEFRYSMTESTRSTAPATGANPPASTTRPGTAPQQ